MSVTGTALHADAVGLRLIRSDKHGRTHFCERVFFDAGRLAVDTVLRRAAIAGRVEIDGKVSDHRADVLTSAMVIGIR